MRFAGRLRLSLPEGWTSISEADLKATVQAVRKPSKTAHYDAAFQQQGSPLFAYPYVLVEVVPYPTRHEPSKADIRGMIAKMGNSSKPDNLTPEAAKMIGPSSVGDVVYDEKRMPFAFGLRSEIAGIGPVRGYCTGFIGHSALVNVLCYCLESDSARFQPLFDQVAGSFRDDAAAAFKGTTPDPKSLWDGVLEKALVNAVVGCFFGVVFGLNQWLKRSRLPKAKPTIA